MTNLTLTDLGWSARHMQRLTPEETETLALARVSSVARDRLHLLSPLGPMVLAPPPGDSTGDFATGDWVSLDPDGRIARRIPPETELARRAAGEDARRQKIAANVDTLGIVTSCNADFNEARLERYLALASGAGCLPLVILTKADLTEDARGYARRAEGLSPLVTAIALDAKGPDVAETLAPWVKTGQTLALLGSSGVGKTTLSNALTGLRAATADIRADDAKGRHTTTARGLIRTAAGGWLIDTPGMRELGLVDAADAIDDVFADISGLAAGCHFADCAHEHEPGCAVLAAVADGTVSPDRVARWQKLRREDARTSASLAETRARDRATARLHRGVQRHSRKRKGR